MLFVLLRLILPVVYRPSLWMQLTPTQEINAFVHCPDGYGLTKYHHNFFEKKLAVNATMQVKTEVEWVKAVEEGTNESGFRTIDNHNVQQLL